MYRKNKGSIANANLLLNHRYMDISYINSTTFLERKQVGGKIWLRDITG